MAEAESSPLDESGIVDVPDLGTVASPIPVGESGSIKVLYVALTFASSDLDFIASPSCAAPCRHRAHVYAMHGDACYGAYGLTGGHSNDTIPSGGFGTGRVMLSYFCVH